MWPFSVSRPLQSFVGTVPTAPLLWSQSGCHWTLQREGTLRPLRHRGEGSWPHTEGLISPHPPSRLRILLELWHFQTKARLKMETLCIVSALMWGGRDLSLLKLWQDMPSPVGGSTLENCSHALCACPISENPRVLLDILNFPNQGGVLKGLCLIFVSESIMFLITMSMASLCKFLPWNPF